jgi:hypothetical protein
MKKILALTLIVIIAVLTSGVYGAIHDQLTYTISPEYYTKFKFIQFGLVDEGPEAHPSNPRLWVAAVGFLATWWMGVPIGLILGLIGLTHTNWRTMFRITLRALAVIMLAAFITGLIGLIYGRLFLANNPVESFNNWFIPDNIIDFKSFITVGCMHNFSYAGGLIGLVAGIIYSLGQKKKQSMLAVA